MEGERKINGRKKLGNPPPPARGTLILTKGCPLLMEKITRGRIRVTPRDFKEGGTTRRAVRNLGNGVQLREKTWSKGSTLDVGRKKKAKKLHPQEG